MRRPGNLLLLAIVIGALAAALVYRHLRTLRSEIEAARQAAPGTVDIVVASDTIPVGGRIGEQQVKLAAWPETLMPDGAIRDPKAVINSIARVTIEKNQPLSKSQLLGQGAEVLPLMIPDGMRAMSVRVDDVTGVSGFITPNSRVDVLVAGAPGGEGNEGQRSKLVLQNIRVLAIGKSITQTQEKPVEVPTVTLLVSPDDAEKLTLATRYEPVRLALRNYSDDQMVGTPGLSTATLFGTPPQRVVPAAPPAAPAPPGAPAARPRPRRPRYSVEVLLGERMTRQELF
jgi:pilus assembly protein CpaB